MSNAPVNKGRRRFLTITTSVVGGVGAAAVAVPFIKSWNPSAKAKAAGAPVEVDISKLEVGQMVRVEWRGKPVWVVRRSPVILEGLGGIRNPVSHSNPRMQQIHIVQLNLKFLLPWGFVLTLVALLLICPIHSVSRSMA